MTKEMSDKVLAGFVGLTFLVALSLMGIYLIFTSVFVCGGAACTTATWTGLALIAAGLTIFTVCLLGHYDTRYYLGR